MRSAKLLKLQYHNPFNKKLTDKCISRKFSFGLPLMLKTIHFVAGED